MQVEIGLKDANKSYEVELDIQSAVGEPDILTAVKWADEFANRFNNGIETVTPLFECGATPTIMPILPLTIVSVKLIDGDGK